MLVALNEIRRRLDRDRQLSLRARVSKGTRFVWSLANAPLVLGGCDLVGRRPRVLGLVRVDNRGHIEFGDELVIDARFAPVAIESLGGTLRLGSSVFVNFGVRLRAGRGALLIGSRTDLGPHCVLDADDASIELGEDVWLGARVRVAAGARIGAGTVVAAGSVVVGTLPPACVAAGRPARVVRYHGGRGGSRRDQTARFEPAPLPPARSRFDEALASGSARRRVLTRSGRFLAATPFTAALWLRGADAVGPGAALAGQPHLENAGRLEIGARLQLHSTPRLTHLVAAAGALLRLGDDISIGAGAGLTAHAGIEVGDGTRIGPGAMLLDFDFHGVEDRDQPLPAAPISVGRNVRIGARALILRGVNIGEGACIRDDSVVVRDVPAFADVSGAPAR